MYEWWKMDVNYNKLFHNHVLLTGVQSGSWGGHSTSRWTTIARRYMTPWPEWWPSLSSGHSRRTSVCDSSEWPTRTSDFQGICKKFTNEVAQESGGTQTNCNRHFTFWNQMSRKTSVGQCKLRSKWKDNMIWYKKSVWNDIACKRWDCRTRIQASLPGCWIEKPIQER